MLFIQKSYSLPNENLAFDEALVEAADEAERLDVPASEALRLWEFEAWAVVMGRGSKSEEVHRQACEAEGVHVLQRCSGGASIVAGPGCLMYSLLLSLVRNSRMREVDYAHRLVMHKMLAAIQSLNIPVVLNGTCDITLEGRKCSGNALRYKRNWMLYHGTILYDLDISRVERYLAMPPRQPSYREQRGHGEFLINLPCDVDRLKNAIAATWQADLSWELHPFAALVNSKSQHLLESKYR